MSREPRLIDWGSGGGLLLIAALLIAAAVGWRAVSLLGSGGHAIGDGRTVASYGFDLTTSLVPADRFTPSGLPREGIPSLDRPPVFPAGEVPAFNEAHRGKYLVSSDRVIGVVVGGEARAYPIRVLNWHEVVNDTVGGVPIAVTFSPLCDSAVVFDRRVAGEVLEFGVSGLLLNSNLVLYDRRPGPSSLWSQLQARAVAGPAAAAGHGLRVLPASLATWRHWTEHHPETAVLRPDPDRLERYRRNPYGSYLTTGKLRFPVDPLPPEDSLPPMTPVLVLDGGGRRFVVPLWEETLARYGRRVAIGDASLELAGPEAPLSVVVRPSPTDATYYSRWFAWYAQHPEPENGKLIGPDFENDD